MNAHLHPVALSFGDELAGVMQEAMPEPRGGLDRLSVFADTARVVVDAGAGALLLDWSTGASAADIDRALSDVLGREVNGCEIIAASDLARVANAFEALAASLGEALGPWTVAEDDSTEPVVVPTKARFTYEPAQASRSVEGARRSPLISLPLSLFAPRLDLGAGHAHFLSDDDEEVFWAPLRVALLDGSPVEPCDRCGGEWIELARVHAPVSRFGPPEKRVLHYCAGCREQREQREPAEDASTDPVSDANLWVDRAILAQRFSPGFDVHDLGERAFELAPKDARVLALHTLLGPCRLDLGDKARAGFKAALAMDERCAIAHFGLGVLAWNEGRGVAALEHYTAALAREPNYIEALANRGTTHAAQGDYSAAIADLDQALALNPGDWVARLARGRVHILEGRLEAAGRDLADVDEWRDDRIATYRRGAAATEAMIVEAPDELPEPWIASAAVPVSSLPQLAGLRGSGRLCIALNDLAVFVELDRDKAPVRSLATAVEAAGRCDTHQSKRFWWLRRAEVAPSAYAWHNVARFSTQADDYEAARLAFAKVDECLAESPYDYDAPDHLDFDRGKLHLRTGELEQARRCYKRAIRHSGFAPARYDLACVLVKLGDRAEALRQLRLAIKSDPECARQARTDPDLASLIPELPG